VFGWIFTAHQIGAAIAALGAGMSRDLLASYIPAFLTGATLCALAALGVLLLSRTRRASGATAD
jgi:uncharacterized membrane protein YeiH